MNRILDRLAHRIRQSLLTALLPLLVSCGGASAIATIIAEGGISGTGISFGSITGFGSVIINGVRLEVDAQTQIFVDEQSATQAELNVGTVVRVDADFEAGLAQRIDYVETVRGPIVSLPVFTVGTIEGSFQLLGQNITTNAATTFANIMDLSMLSPGDVIDISGVRDSSGTIVARYLELLTPPIDEYRVIGAATAVGATRFMIGNLDIDFSAADTSQLAGGLSEGLEVRVKGAATGFDSTTNTFQADVISPNPLTLSIGANLPLQIEGAITRFVSVSDFDVNGIPVDAGSAVYENGTAADLQLDVLIEAEGTTDGNGTLIAERIIIIPLANIRIDSTVDSVDLATESILVQGIRFFFTENTKIEDDSAARIEPFALADLSPGDYVELRGYELDGSYYLSLLEREDFEPEVSIQAPVDPGGVDPMLQTVTLLGITVTTDGSTEYKAEDDMEIDAMIFFSTVQEGDPVKAEWEPFTSLLLPADELSLED